MDPIYLDYLTIIDALDAPSDKVIFHQASPEYVLKHLPPELIFQVFKYVTLNSYTTTTEFFVHVASLADKLEKDGEEIRNDPYINHLMSIVSESKLSILFRRGVVLQNDEVGIKLEPMPVNLIGLYEEFQRFVDILLLLNAKFDEITLNSVYGTSKFVELLDHCCKNLHYNELQCDYQAMCESYHNLNSLTILIPNFNGLDYLNKATNLQKLTVSFGRNYHPSLKERLQTDLDYILQWISTEHPCDIRKKIQIEISFDRSEWGSNVYEFLTELSNIHFIDLEIHLQAISTENLMSMVPYKRFITTIYNEQTKIDLKLVNCFTSLKKFIISSVDDLEDPCDLQFLKKPKLVHLRAFFNKEKYAPIETISNNIESLKTLEIPIRTSNLNFSNFIGLKNLVIKIDHGINGNLMILPPNLAILHINLTFPSFGKSVIVSNQDELKFLKTIRFSITDYGNSVSNDIITKQLQNLVDSLPLSISKFNLKLRIGPERVNHPMDLDFTNLAQLKELKLSNIVLSHLSFPDSIEELSIVYDPKISKGGSFPIYLRHLEIDIVNPLSLEHFFINYINPCKQLSVLSLDLPIIKSIDLETLLPASVSSVDLKIKKEKNFDFSKKPLRRDYIRIHLPFSRNSDPTNNHISHLSIHLGLGHYHAILLGELSDDDKTRLELDLSKNRFNRIDPTGKAFNLEHSK